MPTLSNVQVNTTEGNEVGTSISQFLNARGLYGIKIEEPIVGPIITGFPLKIPPRITLKKVLGLDEELAMACDVEAVTIQRVGNRVLVFVPNKDKKVVNLLDNMSWFMTNDKVKQMKLPILLGQTHTGENMAIDLADQPHILIAGATGGGKSVLESAIIAALALQKSKAELQMYLVDTKRLDLTLFQNLSNVKEVVRTASEWYPVANELYAECQRRQLELEKHGCRNLAEYNAKMKEQGMKELPYVVLIIDELADLKEKDSIQVEEDKRNEEFHDDPPVLKAIQRIIQVSRASGIHIIACTQRTSADIVSPVVRANFPTRIGLKCASKKDSMIIIGAEGCESLLGKGDMLVQHAESEILNRFHGPFVRNEDINAIISQRDMIRQQLLGEQNA